MTNITTLLIANRGEIARRIIRTCREQGIRTVAVYSEADAELPHVREADQSVCLGPAPARDSYLDIGKVIDAARATGAQAVHPGYGFLSENTGFAAACDEAGLIFIGPGANAIRVMGDKAAARQLMSENKVPVLPGFDQESADDATLASEAERVGFPLLIKAVAGGGGKGMRVVESADRFDEALASARREASGAFGDDRVLLERYLPTARHVEVQVFADQHGNAVHLFERDCSVQRRHQKIIEEAPAPGLDEALRERLGEAAVQAARAIDYVGAGTVEFLLAPNGEFFFMEMNTRLQVEHPVTEMITGEDLVAWQIAVAEGRALPKRQDQIQRHGAAMEVRLYAENPYQHFLPSSGTLQPLVWPEGVRVDAGFEAGDTVSDHYDPMIAKLICHGADREQARRRLVLGLENLMLGGIHHNGAFLHRVLSSEPFSQAELDTRLLEKHPHLLEPVSVPVPALAVAAAALVVQRPATGSDPWQALNGWRPLGRRQTLVPLKVLDENLIVILEDNQASVNGVPLPFQFHSDGGRFHLGIDGGRFHLGIDGGTLVDDVAIGDMTFSGRFVDQGERLWLFVAGQDYAVDLHPARESGHDAGHGDFTAPMSGTIVALHVNPGDRVAAGDAVITLEAMKMEHTLRAGGNGIVHGFNVGAGDSVSEGTLLVEFEVEQE
jgi:3-methylcrotonyl-CoA carboxylase alpha subunit